ncbi:small vasohibin-binding protein [Oryzias melastigma]|uniref:Small vasohibin-binding protein n=1 Tax=Oryzias melastigma TaxID=30732 RepID=A0A3B3CX19_ORYME|nr:small vasohibin-binding protein [Oryzias melastigma]
MWQHRSPSIIEASSSFLLLSNITDMEPACRKDKPKLNSTPTRGDRARQKSAQQELKQRQRAEIYALNKVMTELEQQQFEAFCKQMQSQGE